MGDQSVAMRHTASGRTMRASRAAFDREYSGQGWEIVDTAPAADTPATPTPETAKPDESEPKAPAKGRGRARSK